MEALRARLLGAGRVSLSVRARNDGALWEAQGEGTVEVVVEDPHALVLRDSGAWSQARRSGPSANGGAVAANFTDEVRWSFHPGKGTVAVAHLRRGASRPVPLVELAPSGSGRLESLRPHHCGDDRYEAAVELEEEGAVILRWTVRGPGKDQHIVRRYAAGPAPAAEEGRRGS